jgi:hypothetical protein
MHHTPYTTGLRGEEEALQEYTVWLQEKNEEQTSLVHEEQLIKIRAQQRRVAEVEWDVGHEAEERRVFVERKREERELQARKYFRENYVQRVPQFQPQEEASRIGMAYAGEMGKLEDRFKSEFDALYPREEKVFEDPVDQLWLLALEEQREWFTTRALVATLVVGCFLVGFLCTVDPPKDADSACTCGNTENGQGDITIMVNRKNMTIMGTSGGLDLQDAEQSRMNSPMAFAFVCMMVAGVTLAFFRWILRLDLQEEEPEEPEEEAAPVVLPPVPVPPPTLAKRSLPPILRRGANRPLAASPQSVSYDNRYGGGGGGDDDYAGEQSSLRPHMSHHMLDSPIHSPNRPRPSNAGLERML